MTKPSPVPTGQTLFPYLTAKDAALASAFYQRAFAAHEELRIADGARIGHAELRIGEVRFMLSDEYPEIGCLSPGTLGGTTAGFMVYVPDVDSFAATAIAAGAVLERPIKDEFHGDRVAVLRDPFGHRWYFASRFEDVSREEMKRRAAAAAP